MAANSDGQDPKAAQVGRLIRSYRHDRVRAGRGLTQDGLLALMAEIDPRYSNLSHSYVSRWENGRALPERDALIAIGRALEMPDAELEGLLRLADYESISDENARNETLQRVRKVDSRTEGMDDRTADIQRGVRFLVDSASEPPLDAKALAKDAFRRAAPPGIYAAAVGWALNALGLDGTWILVAYAAAALAIAVGQGALRLRGASAVSELFFITLFFILNASLLGSAITRMDHFGFYALIPWGGTSYFLLLTLIAHLALALAASVIFDVLRIRMYSRNGPRRAFARAIWTSLPPCLFVFFTALVFVNEGGWASYFVTLGVAVGAFTAILAFQDGEAALSEYEAKLTLAALVAVIILLCAAGAAGTIVAYWDPNPRAMPDHNLLMSWEIDFERLGYPPEELEDRIQMGILLMSVSAIVYLATALGGFLVAEARGQLKRAEAASGAPNPNLVSESPPTSAADKR